MFKYRFILGGSMKEIADDLREKGDLDFQPDEYCGGITFHPKGREVDTCVALPINCPVKAILHEAIHVYTSLVFDLGLDSRLNPSTDENHAYLLSFLQNQLIEAVLEAKKVLSEETKKIKQKPAKKKKYN